MFGMINLRLVAAGALAIAALSLPAYASAARDHSAATNEFSAQSNQDPKKKKVAPKKVTPRQAPRHVAPRQGAPRQGAPRQVGPAGGRPKVGAPASSAPRIVRPNVGGPKPARRVFTPRGTNARVVTAARIRSAPPSGAFRTSIRGRNYSVWRSGYRLRHGNGWRTFVALGALGVIAIGAAEYYPYAYISAPEPYCDGRTEDGCQLVWDDVETVEGDRVAQCVAYCPWQ